MTPWTSALLDDAEELVAAGRHRAALGCVLTVLSVYPDSQPALQLAASLAYYGTRATVAEPLTDADICDPRLDSLFCSCQGAGCTFLWVSAGLFMPGDITVNNPRGGRCGRCDSYFCRHHFGRDGACPQCGGDLDHAPRVSNGRAPMQMVRLNQPLVHVQVMREGTGRISPDYLTELLSTMAPDAFEDSPTITGSTIHSWPDDCQGLAMARIAYEHPEYLTDSYDMRVADGRDQAGTRWVLVKIFATMPKYVDPDYSPGSGEPGSGEPRRA
jgi:hypothetical protein